MRTVMKDNERLVVFDERMKTLSFTEFVLRCCSGVFLLALTVGGLCLIPDSHYNWIDGQGPIVGFCIITFCLFILSIRWVFKKR